MSTHIETPKLRYEKLSSMKTRLLDSGAYYRMTGCLANLSDIKEIDFIPVGLPNGKYSMGTKCGSTRLIRTFHPQLGM